MYVISFAIFSKLGLYERNVLEKQEVVEPKKASTVTFDDIPVIWVYKPDCWLHHYITLVDEDNNFDCGLHQQRSLTGE